MRKSDDVIFFKTTDLEVKRALIAGEYVQVDGATLVPFAFPRPSQATAAPPAPASPEK